MADENRYVIRASAAYTAIAGAVQDSPEIWVSDGRIEWMGRQGERPLAPNYQLIDLSGHWLLPGFIDAHVHVFGVDFKDPTSLLNVPLPIRTLVASRDMMSLLLAGVTAIRCVGNPIGPFLVRAIRERVIPGPHMITTGEHICRTGGAWDPIQWPVEWVESWDMLTDGVDECIKRVRQRARQGCELIKVGGSVGEHLDFSHAWGDDPDKNLVGYSDAEMIAMVEEAHRNKMRVAAHCIGDEPVRQALRVGVDTIEHAHGSSEETYRMIADKGVTVVPTLTLPALRARLGAERGLAPHLIKVWEKHLAVQFASLELALKHNVKLGVGTDCIGPPHTPMGSNMVEMELLVEGGMTPEQVLEACYVRGRELMGMEKEIGALEPGRHADIVALVGDPRDDIGRVRKPVFVMKGGVVFLDSGDRLTKNRGLEMDSETIERLSAVALLAEVEHLRAHADGRSHMHIDPAAERHGHHSHHQAHHHHHHGHSHSHEKDSPPPITFEGGPH
jgi:imidazolonepropionase-like amidohydrolase